MSVIDDWSSSFDECGVDVIFLGVWLFITDVLTDFDKEDCGVLTPEILNLNMLSNIHHPSQGKQVHGYGWIIQVTWKSSLPLGVETWLGVLFPHEESDL